MNGAALDELIQTITVAVISVASFAQRSDRERARRCRHHVHSTAMMKRRWLGGGGDDEGGFDAFPTGGDDDGGADAGKSRLHTRRLEGLRVPHIPNRVANISIAFL